ncbi:VOC family virulence protein [Agrobacterium vitis]|uniref:VOC family protein n=1 Tax=Agrobacterium vitis TaxID=373 RepID=UPI001F27154D|nr:VOC family protein [Agrobacterium vitis]MCF1467669.1 VOC family virulence protein [Agrobacterium vitis]
MADLPVNLDHAVIHVSDWERARDFYTNVIGAEAVTTAAGGYVFRLGAQQLNVHGPGAIGTPVARIPVAPGNSDLCFRWRGKISDAKAHLEAQGIDIELGPIRRFGAMGEGTSLYFRDPDGSLMEFISYDD